MSCRLYKKSQRVLVSRCPITLQFALCCRLRAGANATNRSARLMPWQSQVPTWLHLQGPRAQQTCSTQRSQRMRMQSPPTQPWMSSCCPMTMTAAVQKNQLLSPRGHVALSLHKLQTLHPVAFRLRLPTTLRRGHPWQHKRLDSCQNLLPSLLVRCCRVLAPSQRAKHSRTAFRSRSHQRLASRQQRRRHPPQASQLLLGQQLLQPQRSKAARVQFRLMAAHRHVPMPRHQRTSLWHQRRMLRQLLPRQCSSCRPAMLRHQSESVPRVKDLALGLLDCADLAFCNIHM
jgi:hypothetical protein